MKIAIYPLGSNLPNKYIERMVEAIKYAYPDVQITSLPSLRRIFSLKGYDSVWLNWFENPSDNSKVRNYLSKILFLIFLRVMGIKVISTFHNKRLHESKNFFWDRIMFWVTFRFATRILILSSDSREILKNIFGKSILKKIILVPHPTYDCIPKPPCKITDHFRILFLGQLRPYKNIELIFNLAKEHPDIPFTIAGKPFNEQYERKLLAQVKEIPNITLIPHFLSSGDFDDLINRHSILLLPYNLKSSLNSGVVIHAICKGINMIVPKIGTVNQFKNKDQIFSYSYNSNEDHYKQLNKMIRIVKNEYENDLNKFNKRIRLLYNEVITTQTPQVLSLKLKNVL